MKTVPVLLAALVLAAGAAAGQAPPQEQGPGELWSEYPLTETTPSPPPATTPSGQEGARPAPGGVIRAPDGESRIGGLAAIAALLAGALVIVTLVFFATRFVTDSFLLAVSATAKGVPAMSKLFRRRPSDERPDSEESRSEAEPETGRPLADMVTSYTAYRSVAGPSTREGGPEADLAQPTGGRQAEGAAEPEPSPPQREPEPEPEPEPEIAAPPARASRREPEVEPEPEPARAAAPSARYADLGQQIADVLRVAEEKAEQVLAEAHAEAARIRKEAEGEAHEARRRFEQQTEDERSEARRIRADAEAYAEERRRKADEEATAVRSEAETEARALREAGEEIRRRLEQEGLAKQQEILTTSTTIEARLRAAMETSRAVADEIERLLDGRSSADEDDATLAEALELQQRRQ